MDGTVGQALLSAFGARIGLPDIRFEDGHAAVAFDDIEINIEYRAVGQSFLLYAAVLTVGGRIPEALLLKIAEINYGIVMTGAGALALDTAAGRVLLVSHLPVEAIDAAAFERRLKAMVDEVELLAATFAMPAQVADDRPVTDAEIPIIRA